MATTAQRGYGYRHQRERARWALRVARGGVVCARCGFLILPGTPWHLGHDDFDRTRWTGPEHQACNTATAAHRARRARRLAPRPVTSRNW